LLPTVPPLEEGMGAAHDALDGPRVEGGSQFVLEFLHRKNFIEYRRYLGQIKDYGSCLGWFRMTPREDISGGVKARPAYRAFL
jgi:hypothetical protein